VTVDWVILLDPREPKPGAFFKKCYKFIPFRTRKDARDRESVQTGAGGLTLSIFPNFWELGRCDQVLNQFLSSSVSEDAACLPASRVGK
jgi:hypothetical protein